MLCLKIIAVCFWFVLVPAILGDKGTDKHSEKENPVLSYVMGWMKLLAVFQILAIPSIFLKMRLTVLVILWSLLVLAWMIYLLWKNKGHYITLVKNAGLWSWHLCIYEYAAVFFIILQVVGVTMFASSDADDAMYVSTAVTADYTDTMFQYVGDTGAEYGQFPTRYVMSPFPIFVAALSRLISIHPTIVAHTILPVFFIPLSYCVYYLLFMELFGKNRRKAALGLCFLSLLNVWGNVSVYTAATFLFLRIWQGKAILANVILPLVIYWLFLVYDNALKSERLCMKNLMITMTAGCLVSSMGIFLEPMLAGVFAVVFALKRKEIRMFIQILTGCLPNVIYGLWYLVLISSIQGQIPRFL